MNRLHKLSFILLGIITIGALTACQSSEFELCPEGFEETQNIGYGEDLICCPYGTTGVDGMCVEEEKKAPVQTEQNNIYTPKEESTPQTLLIVPDDFVYLTAPNEKGSAYCPQEAGSLAWNGIQFKCCGKELNSVVVPSREDSLCCPQESSSARWIGKSAFDYECCPKGTVEVKNEGEGDKYICCPQGQIGKDGECIVKSNLVKDDKILMTALGNKGKAYCPKNANSLAWDGKEFQCCGKNMKATVIPSRSDSICCPDKTTDARWVGKKWNDFECCPAGTVETKNVGDGDKYICCPKGDKASNGKCSSDQ
ncbi:MAG: hypothetical protein J6Y03_01750 [Alphaproteobacteria bacterium]|nr:hypothetical protein [Alphaproteobacteria bacterium]